MVTGEVSRRLSKSSRTFDDYEDDNFDDYDFNDCVDEDVDDAEVGAPGRQSRHTFVRSSRKC